MRPTKTKSRAGRTSTPRSRTRGGVTSTRAAAAALPRIRVLYLVPTDIDPRPGALEVIERAVRHLQHWYREQLDNEKTFTLHSPVVELVRADHDAAWFSEHESHADKNMRFWLNATNEAFALAGGSFNDPQNIWNIYLDADEKPGQVMGGAQGVCLMPRNDVRGLLGQNTGKVCRWVGGFGHELGHALGLPHPPGCGEPGNEDNHECQSLMYLGYTNYDDTFLRDADKVRLDTSPFFRVQTLEPLDFDCSLEDVS
ncbi:MAG: hypothetical protein ACRD9R_19585 [Pyrinomonadaceae bacterium]